MTAPSASQPASASRTFPLSRKAREGLLTNLALIIIIFVALVPVATTVLISFKREEDVTRKPPVIFPCDTPTSKFDLTGVPLVHRRLRARGPADAGPGRAAGVCADGPDAQHLPAQHGALRGDAPR